MNLSSVGLWSRIITTVRPFLNISSLPFWVWMLAILKCPCPHPIRPWYFSSLSPVPGSAKPRTGAPEEICLECASTTSRSLHLHSHHRLLTGFQASLSPFLLAHQISLLPKPSFSILIPACFQPYALSLLLLQLLSSPSKLPPLPQSKSYFAASKPLPC